MATNPGTVLQVVCNFNMLYIGCQYQVIKKVKKKKRKADLPYPQGAEERGLFSVNLNKQSSYLVI